MVAGTPRNPLEVCRMTDYVKIGASEMVYGEASLLQSQLNLINLLKQYREYEKLRNEELVLKIKLKKNVGEARESLDKLSKILPESKFLEKRKKEEELQEEITEKIERAVQKSRKKESKRWEEKPEEGKKQSLDQELEEIRKKLEKLQ